MIRPEHLNKALREQETMVTVLTLNRTYYFHIIDSAHIVRLSDSMFFSIVQFALESSIYLAKCVLNENDFFL